MGIKKIDREYTCILMIGDTRYFLRQINFLRDAEDKLNNKAIWSKSDRTIVPLTMKEAETIAKWLTANARDVRVVKLDHVLH